MKTWAPKEWLEAAFEYASEQCDDQHKLVGLAAVRWQDGTRGFEISFQQLHPGNMLSIATVTEDEIAPYVERARRRHMVPIAEAAAATGVAESTIRKYAASGTICAEKRHGYWYVLVEDVERLVKSGEIVTRSR